MLPDGEYCWHGKLSSDISAATLCISEHPRPDSFNRKSVCPLSLGAWGGLDVQVSGRSALDPPWTPGGCWCRGDGLWDAVIWVNVLVLGFQRQSWLLMPAGGGRVKSVLEAM